MSTRRPRSPSVGLRYRLGDGDRPDSKASVCDEQQLQRQPDVPCRLVDWDRSRHRVRMFERGQPASRRTRIVSFAGAKPIDVRGHPTGVRCTDLHSETGSAGVRRHPTPRDDRFAAP